MKFEVIQFGLCIQAVRVTWAIVLTLFGVKFSVEVE